MRLLLLTAAVVAVLLATSTALEIQTADVAPLLNLIPGVANFEALTDLLGLPGILEVLPATLLSPETSWDKARAILAATGVAIIEITAFVGYILNYLNKITTINLEIREAKEAAAEAATEAAEGEAPAEGQERFIIVPFNSPTVNPVINPRPNIRRVYQPPFNNMQYNPYPNFITGKQSFQPRPYRRHKREETPGSVLGEVYEAGKHILWLLKRVFLKEARKETVAKEITHVVDVLKEDLMHRIDEDGCLQKLVCHLQEKPEKELTAEEDMMQVFFQHSHTNETCAPENFPRCFLSGTELDEMLIAMPKNNLNFLH